MFCPSDSLDNILPCHLSCAGLGEDPNDFHIPRGYPRPLSPSLQGPGLSLVTEWALSLLGLSGPPARAPALPGSSCFQFQRGCDGGNMLD